MTIYTIYYKDREYRYEVSDKKLVEAKEVSYLGKGAVDGELVLMTCSPAGTSLKRRLVFAKLKE